jgi:YD repeat-containing protein
LLETTTLGHSADSRTYTSFGELDTWTGTVDGNSAYTFDLDRDTAGRITTRTETLGGTTHVWTYTYDPQRGWLTEVERDGVVVESYDYDGNGNRTSWEDFWGSGSATYDDQDRLLTFGPTSYAYTTNGELLSKTEGSDVTTYAYDVRGALLGVHLPTGVQIDYLVDAGGRRIGKKVDGQLVQGFLYGGGLAPVAETDGAGQVTSLFVYATKGNVPDYSVEAEATYRIVTDHLGSVRMVVDIQSGAVLQQIAYDAFGRITFDSNPGV